MLDRLLGRRPEQDAIAALLAHAAGGCGGALMLHGELGIGKTALLAWAAAHAQSFVVLSVAAQEAESAMPSAAMHRLLHLLVEEVPGPPAVEALVLAETIEGNADAFAVSVALLRLLCRVARQRPLLCLVDDAHWLDALSSGTLAFVARRLHNERIAMLLCRGHGRDPVEPVTGIPTRRIGPLEHRTGRALARSLVPVPDVAGVLATVAMGNPGALIELARSLTA